MIRFYVESNLIISKIQKAIAYKTENLSLLFIILPIKVKNNLRNVYQFQFIAEYNEQKGML